MYQYEFDEGQRLEVLVKRYEKMVAENASYFFDKQEFEQLVDHFEEEGFYEKAFDVVNAALDQYPFSGILTYKKASLLFDNGNDVSALSIVRQAKALEASEVEVYLLESEILSFQRNYKQALEVLEDGLSYLAISDHLELWMAIAGVHEDRGDYTKEFEAFREALQIKPECSEALARIWVCADLGSKNVESIAFHEQLIDKVPYNYMAWYNLGQAHVGLENYAEAARAFEYSFIIRPDYMDAYRECLESFYNAGLYTDVLKVYETAVQEIKIQPFFYGYVGLALEGLKKYKEACKFLLKGISESPNDDFLHKSLGDVYSKLREWMPAISSYRRSIEINNEDESYFYALGEALHKMGRDEDAELSFKKAIEVGEGNPQSWIHLTGFLIEIDRVKEASEVADQAFAKNNNDISLMYCHLACQFLLGNYQEGRILLLKAMERNYEMLSSLLDFLPSLKDCLPFMEVIVQYEEGTTSDNL